VSYDEFVNLAEPREVVFHLNGVLYKPNQHHRMFPRRIPQVRHQAPRHQQHTLHGLHAHASMTPYIIEERQLNVAQMDVFSRLMMDRIIFLGTGINDQVANIIQAQLLFLESVDAKKDIQIYMNSPGGGVYAGLGSMIPCNTSIPMWPPFARAWPRAWVPCCLCAGTKGKRSALKHARVMIHQPMGGAEGQASDMEITVREMLKLKKELYDIISTHSGQPIEKVEKDSDRDYWMIAEEAKAYGMIDEAAVEEANK
jgi:ATP-dependent Clp protease protease subunit